MTAVEAPPQTAHAFRVERQGDLAIIWFDLPGEKVNKFSSTVIMEFATIVDEMEKSRDIKRIVLASAKPNIFIAGDANVILSRGRHGRDVARELLAAIAIISISSS